MTRCLSLSDLQEAHPTAAPNLSRSSRSALLAAPSSSADTSRERTLLEIRALDSVEFAATALHPPGGSLLVQQGTAIRAVRFTRFHRASDRKLAGMVLSGAGRTSAEYNWYFQGDGSGDFTKPNATYGRGKLRETPGFRVGRFAFKPFAELYVRCGPLVVRWRYPNALVFNLDALGSRGENALALAPTKAAHIRDVHLKKMRLTWYRLDSTRTAPLFIPLEQLP